MKWTSVVAEVFAAEFSIDPNEESIVCHWIKGVPGSVSYQGHNLSLTLIPNWDSRWTPRGWQP